MALNGKVVFSSGLSVDFDIWSFDLESGTLSQLTNGKNLNDFPRWSPDGSLVAYVSVQEDSIASLWVMDANGGAKRRLTNNVYCQAPSWSPDGARLIFTGNVTNRSEIEVCAVDLDGGNLTTLFNYSGTEKTPSFSPDGKKVLFSAPSGDENQSLPSRDTEIVEYDIAGGSFTVLCAHPAKDYAPVYSPSGSHISFVSHRNNESADEYQAAYQKFTEIVFRGTNAEARAAMVQMKKFERDGDIFVMKSDGTDLTQITHDALADNGVCWSPCEGYLMYTSARVGQNESERLKIIDAKVGTRIPFQYDRKPFEQEIGSFQLLNATFFQRIIPNFIEKNFVDSSFWGEERHPHWTR